MRKIKNQKLLFLSYLVVLVFLAGLLVNPVYAGLQDEISLESLKTPTEVRDLIANFQLLEFSMVGVENERVIQDMQLKYQYLGKEEVQGISADKVVFEVTQKGKQQSPMYFWLDEDELVQMESDGTQIAGAMVERMGERSLEFVFFPFYILEQLGLEKIDEMLIENISRTQGMVGEIETDIIELEVLDVEVTIDGKQHVGTGTIKIAELEELLLVTEYEFFYNDDEYKFQIDSLELR